MRVIKILIRIVGGFEVGQLVVLLGQLSIAPLQLRGLPQMLCGITIVYVQL